MREVNDGKFIQWGMLIYIEAYNWRVFTVKSMYVDFMNDRIEFICMYFWKLNT
jgi:hypothetical protein